MIASYQGVVGESGGGSGRSGSGTTLKNLLDSPYFHRDTKGPARTAQWHNRTPSKKELNSV